MPLAIVDKRRTDINVTEVMNVIGDVKGRTCLILDDIVDTAGNALSKPPTRLMEQGAERFMRALRTPCSPARRWNALRLHGLEENGIVTNTIPLSEERRRSAKIKVLSIAGPVRPRH